MNRRSGTGILPVSSKRAINTQASCLCHYRLATVQGFNARISFRRILSPEGKCGVPPGETAAVVRHVRAAHQGRCHGPVCGVGRAWSDRFPPEGAVTVAGLVG